MSNERFFYHSFPRTRKDSDAKHAHGLAILESILERGLLLTPEIRTFQERRQGGAPAPQWSIAQKRICFTELSPAELPAHARTFGAFALEWEIDTLRAMGAIPTFYVPMHAQPESLEGVGAAMLARLGEIEQVLNRLRVMQEVASHARPNEAMQLTLNGLPIAATRATAGGAVDLLACLTADTQPVADLEAALKWASGLVYPIDDPRYPGPLRYYRQREWKILANMVQEGVAITRRPSAEEIRVLLALDPDFFGRPLEFPTGTEARADQCQFYSEFRGKPVASFVRRIIAPELAVNDVTSRLKSRGLSIEVTVLESLAGG